MLRSTGAGLSLLWRRLSAAPRHLSAAIQKLNARNRAEAARIAEDNGWL